jgi:hypothetical protein
MKTRFAIIVAGVMLATSAHAGEYDFVPHEQIPLLACDYRLEPECLEKLREQRKRGMIPSMRSLKEWLKDAPAMMSGFKPGNEDRRRIAEAVYQENKQLFLECVQGIRRCRSGDLHYYEETR